MTVQIVARQAVSAAATIATIAVRRLAVGATMRAGVCIAAAHILVAIASMKKNKLVKKSDKHWSGWGGSGSIVGTIRLTPEAIRRRKEYARDYVDRLRHVEFSQRER